MGGGGKQSLLPYLGGGGQKGFALNLGKRGGTKEFEG